MCINSVQTIREILSGGIVALPTETVYGLAASIQYPDAIQKVFTIKGRPSDNPLIVHVASIEQLEPYITFFPQHFDALVEAFWPGSLTLVLEANRETVPEIVRAGLPTVAVRIPSHAETLHILSETGPLVMPSANISGRPSATTASHVIEDFGEAVAVLDGGNCLKGVESTILIHRNEKWIIARQGAVSAEELEAVLCYLPLYNINDDKPLCPGHFYRHYAPKASLTELISTQPGVVVGFADRDYPFATAIYALGDSFNPESAAKNLYRVLRQLDRDQVATAQIDMNFPAEGLWSTVRERLKKAAFQDSK